MCLWTTVSLGGVTILYMQDVSEDHNQGLAVSELTASEYEGCLFKGDLH